MFLKMKLPQCRQDSRMLSSSNGALLIGQTYCGGESLSLLYFLWRSEGDKRMHLVRRGRRSSVSRRAAVTLEAGARGTRTIGVSICGEFACPRCHHENGSAFVSFLSKARLTVSRIHVIPRSPQYAAQWSGVSIIGRLGGDAFRLLYLCAFRPCRVCSKRPKRHYQKTYGTRFNHDILYKRFSLPKPE